MQLYCNPTTQPHSSDVVVLQYLYLATQLKGSCTAIPLLSHTVQMQLYCYTSTQLHSSDVVVLLSHYLATQFRCSCTAIPLLSHTVQMQLYCYPTTQPHSSDVVVLLSHYLATQFRCSCTPIPLLSHIVQMQLYCYPTTQPHSSSHKWGICCIWGGGCCLFPVDTSHCPTLSAHVLQLAPFRICLCLYGRQGFASSPETYTDNSATNSADLTGQCRFCGQEATIQAYVPVDVFIIVVVLLVNHWQTTLECHEFCVDRSESS